MSNVIQQCNAPEPRDKCERLRAKITKLVLQTKGGHGCTERGLQERIYDQIYGKHGPGTPEWNGHDQQITQLKRQIRKLMDEYINNNCRGGGGKPFKPEVKQWINRPNPSPSDWKGPMPVAEPVSRSIFDWEYWEEMTGLTGAALVLYLIISEGSRLFPARNAIPIP